MMQLRIMKQTYEEIRLDLARTHPHAWERVGFAFVRSSGNSVLIVTGYLPIPDEHYIEDKTVGAKISHKAIALAMKRADHKNEGILHVHEHSGLGIPAFSPTDVDSHGGFLKSFRNANPSGTHGFLVLSRDNMLTRLWIPGDLNPQDTTNYTIVGLPILHRVLRSFGL